MEEGRKKKKKKRKIPQKCKSPVQRQRFITTIKKKSVTEKKKKISKASLYFIVPIKSTSTKGRKKGKKEKKSERIYRTSPNIRIISVFLESLLSESFPLLGVTVYLTSLGCPPTLLSSGPAVGKPQIVFWSYSDCALASKVHSFQNQCLFFCGSSQWPFTYSIDTESAQLIVWI